ncbi:hypothetical protein ACH5RR_022053 [Cinchona calisaya]|uniref:Uncharacterized protein n=1 Tax=Cinchona calisaya TaxID=153742 RepID=A0ABD2Z6P7_9GENT
MDCMVKYIQAKLDNNVSKIPCPALNCAQFFDPHALSNSSGPESSGIVGRGVPGVTILLVLRDLASLFIAVVDHLLWDWGGCFWGGILPYCLCYSDARVILDGVSCAFFSVAMYASQLMAMREQQLHNSAELASTRGNESRISSHLEGGKQPRFHSGSYLRISRGVEASIGRTDSKIVNSLEPILMAEEGGSEGIPTILSGKLWAQAPKESTGQSQTSSQD